MKFRKMKYIYVLIIIIVFSFTINAADIMKLEEIEQGMEGVARTVFQGYKVEEFPVEILDIIKDHGLDKSLILFKAGGERIEEVGGIASGMSGSPVYIGGKLIGAISYGWSLTDHRYGMITPIEDMMELLEYDLSEKKSEYNSIQLKTPLFISGMQGRSFDRIKNKFEKLGFEVLQGGSFSKASANQETLEAGSAVAVQLVRGDINVASIGTLTYKENEKILAFGHPFSNKGDVDYLLSRAYVNAIIPSIQSPFKLGAVTDDLIGSVIVDRGAGVAGRLNRYPKIIPLSIKVTDIERDKGNTVNVQLVKDEDLLTGLITDISLQAVDDTLDRIGKGTAKVNLKITGKGLPELGIERSNVFYSRNDIAAVALYEVYNLFNIINTNPFKKVELIDIKINIDIENIDNVALIQEARVLNDTIKAGDTLDIELTLLPYRSEPVVQRISIEIPEDMNPGMATLVIDGGFTGASYQSIPEEEHEYLEANQAIIEGYKDLESILEDYLKRAKNNELIVQIYPPYSAMEVNHKGIDIEEDNISGADNDIDNEGDSKGNSVDENREVDMKPSEEKDPDVDKTNDANKEIKELFPTDYVLEGSLYIDLNIEGESEESIIDNADI